MRARLRITRASILAVIGLGATAAAGFAATVTVTSQIIATEGTTLRTPASATYTYSPSVSTSATTPTTEVTASCVLWPASLDAFVNQLAPTGSSPNATILSVSSTTNAAKYALIQFTKPPPGTCTGLAGGQVVSAYLQLWIGTQVSGRTLNVLRVTSGWTSSVTWNTKPTVAASPTATVTLTQVAGKQYSIDVTSDVASWVQTGAWPANAPLPPYGTPPQGSNFGWELLNPTAASPDTISITASHSTNNRQRPQLVVNYVY